MSPEELEELLAAAPTQTLSPAAERRILASVLAAGERRRGWWARRIPLWQALVVCAAAGLLAFSWARTGVPGEGPVDPAPRPGAVSEPTAALVCVGASELGWRVRPAYRTDISRWSHLEPTLKGEPSP